MNRSDEMLIADHRAGDASAFPELLSRHLPQVYSFIYHLGGGAETEDIVQDVFVKVWKNLKKFDPKTALFKTWLSHIARNTTIDFLRKRRPIPFSSFENEDEGESFAEVLPDESPLPDELFATGERAKTLRNALQELSRGAREVLLLRYEQELTFEEIGSTLGQPLNTVKSRHRRALIALRELLSGDQNEL